ncbi:hypothetical protein EIN_187090 [Entamoeba invadens IP1]|uniref:hypothetical protein n=1 Tax=Entamoeba invadens IP1 TaxID=370355 RepID=UPI0002C3E5D8|nr:hypothetical protein EIN_187090 [Entamoeba invadens IP1]ELP94252.1 hypothetical protein EIN_187090 [Entamoeba invadens IP1]|eukprot:XP_004261023.1 hypothetical protein EIN_187090 [Entamoeba invadens IP1]
MSRVSNSFYDVVVQEMNDTYFAKEQQRKVMLEQLNTTPLRLPELSQMSYTITKKLRIQPPPISVVNSIGSIKVPKQQTLQIQGNFTPPPFPMNTPPLQNQTKFSLPPKLQSDMTLPPLPNYDIPKSKAQSFQHTNTVFSKMISDKLKAPRTFADLQKQRKEITSLHGPETKERPKKQRKRVRMDSKRTEQSATEEEPSLGHVPYLRTKKQNSSPVAPSNFKDETMYMRVRRILKNEATILDTETINLLSANTLNYMVTFGSSVRDWKGEWMNTIDKAALQNCVVDKFMRESVSGGDNGMFEQIIFLDKARRFLKKVEIGEVERSVWERRPIQEKWSFACDILILKKICDLGFGLESEYIQHRLIQYVLVLYLNITDIDAQIAFVRERVTKISKWL